MANQYEANSLRYSQGYAEPERKYNQTTDYQMEKRGFADSLENKYYYDSPSQPQNKLDQEDRFKNYQPTNSARYQAYDEPARAQNYAEPAYNAQSSQVERYNTQRYDYREQERQENLNVRYSASKEYQPDYQKQQMSYTTDDSQPSQTTMQYSSAETHDNPFEDYHEKGKTVDKQYTINTKGKVLIAVYALVVITVFALIILNTQLLKSMNASYVEKQTKIEQLSEEVNSLHQELDYVSSDEVIEQKAEEKGMIKVE